MNEMAKKKESTPGENLAKQIIEQYNPKSIADMKNALKDIFGPMFEAMIQGEMNSHLGYESNDHGAKSTDNRRNTSQKIKTSSGEVDIKVPRDRNTSFEPRLVPKRQKDVSEIEEKVLAMYARGMSQRDIAETIKDIYGFEISHEMISQITDCVLDELNDWQNRPLKRMYTFLFVDCMYVTIRKEYESKNYAVYTILGYDTNGEKDVLGLWLNESESKHTWMQIFDELKTRGVEDVLFISMDGVPGLEEGAKAIFKDVVVQRCIVHLIRNSIKYVPSKDYKKFTQSLKKSMVHRVLQPLEKPLSSSVRNGHSIRELLMYGNEISTMLNSFLITAVKSEKLCTLQMQLRVSIPALERSPKKEPSQTKTHSLNYSISGLPRFTKNGTEARCKIGLWSEINLPPTTKLKPVLINTNT